MTERKYEVAVAATNELRNYQYVIKQLEIQHDEYFEPKYKIEILVDEYLSQLTVEEIDLLLVDAHMIDRHVKAILELAHESYEYAPIWEARKKGELKKANDLFSALQSRVYQKVKNANSVKVDLQMDDLSEAEMDQFIELMQERNINDQEMYAKQQRDLERIRNGKTEDELTGEQDGRALYERHAHEPAAVEQEYKRVKKERTEEFGPEDDFLRGFINGYMEMKMAEEQRNLRTRRLNDRYVAEKRLNDQMRAEDLLMKTKEFRDFEQAEKEKNGGTSPSSGASSTTTSSSTSQASTASSTNKSTTSSTTSSTNANPYTKTTGSTGGYNNPYGRTGKDKGPQVDDGFFNYADLPDGDQLDTAETPEHEGLPDDVYRPMEFAEDRTTRKGGIDRMKETRKNNPKLGKTLGEATQKGVALGRTFGLPDADDTVKRARITFRKKPLRYLRVRASEFFRRHRKPILVMTKLTAFVAIQLGINTMAGRFEFKEDRHFVQAIALTMMSFYLTQSLNKDGLPVGEKAFVM